jgi:hypothetical protein
MALALHTVALPTKWSTEPEMIGNCDACDRQNVPVSNCRSPSGETTQCFLCQGDTNPDPYGEMQMIKQHVEQPEELGPMGICDCGFAADACGTNPCMRKKIHLAGLTPGSKWPNTGQPAPAAPSSASVAGDTRSADAPRKALDGAGWPQHIRSRLSTEIIRFDDAGAGDDHPVKGITMGHIRRWFEQVEEYEVRLLIIADAASERGLLDPTLRLAHKFAEFHEGDDSAY